MDLIALSVTWALFSTATIAATVSFIQINALFATVNPPVVFIFAGCVGPILLSFMNHVLNFHKRSKSPCDFNVCGIEIDYGINYQCDYCDFIMHRQCLSLKPNIKYQAHQHDLLTLLQNNDKSYKSQCHACGFDIKSIFFVQCLECRLNFHVRCGSASASLPPVAQHNNHSHPLSLVTNESKALVKDDSILLYCNDCKEEIDPMAVLNVISTTHMFAVWSLRHNSAKERDISISATVISWFFLRARKASATHAKDWTSRASQHTVAISVDFIVTNPVLSYKGDISSPISFTLSHSSRFFKFRKTCMQSLR